ncbi:MAG: M1 family metallopeptidase, partial [Ferruginibacter sp.]|nr:M1 family metallopeptidase [Cytophagales bacterium]
RPAVNPPWDGGFSWKKDSTGKPWVAVSCEGVGASLWWPCKDHPSDEPDSVRIRCQVPSSLTCVANGNLRSKRAMPGGYAQYDWFVSYPINPYNVTLNIADYAHFTDAYAGADGAPLALDYYVLRANEKKARQHFQQVKPMLACYEKYFGPYPFPRDGYALVETPYWGMEHQSAVAYGNHYQNNAFGFDFIIVHESGHEWWGNSVSCRDHAELWIHESFGTYAEALYVEDTQGYDTMLRYLEEKKERIKNQHPILGPLSVNYHRWPDSDMYVKGTWMLHTLRNAIADDSLWFGLLRGLATDFRLQNITTEQVIAYVNRKTGKDYTYFFDQYLRHAQPPTLEYQLWAKGRSVSLRYRWQADVKGFAMPIRVGFGKAYPTTTLQPTTAWQTILLDGDQADFRVATELFYVLTK